MQKNNRELLFIDRATANTTSLILSFSSIFSDSRSNPYLVDEIYE
ncbi:MAG: hypothetical protein ACRC2R_19875 [Xenococcaceae cyanobacterium]